MTGLATLAGYTAPPSKYVESIENLIAQLAIVATGNGSAVSTDTVCSVDAAFLRLKTRLMENTDVTRTDIGTANGAYPFETNFKKYFVDPRSNRAGLTVMHTELLSSLMASFQFRDQTAMALRRHWWHNHADEHADYRAVAHVVESPPRHPIPYVKETQRTTNIGAQQNGMRIMNVPVSNVLRRQYFRARLAPSRSPIRAIASSPRSASLKVRASPCCSTTPRSNSTRCTRSCGPITRCFSTRNRFPQAMPFSSPREAGVAWLYFDGRRRHCGQLHRRGIHGGKREYHPDHGTKKS